MSASPLIIEKIINGGYGFIHREDGQVTLIRHTLPGEKLLARDLLIHKGYTEAVITQILEPSPQRITPPCPHYGICGGCDLQHCGYEEQLRIKKAIIEDLLRRSPEKTLRQATALLADPVASPQTFGYRQRLRLQIDDKRRPGFRRFHSHASVPISSCLLARSELNTTLQQLPGHPAFQKLLALTTDLELLFNPSSTKVIVLFHLTRRPRPSDLKQAQSLAAALPDIEEITFHGPDFQPCHLSTSSGKKTSGTLGLALPVFPGHCESPITLIWETGGFCQVNLEQNIRLIQIVLNFCQSTPRTSILDLFCGMGNFSIPLAMNAESLLGVEGQGAAIRSARNNSARAGQNNTHFEKSPIHQRCQSLLNENRTFDCVVIDPPRQGAPGLAATLAAITRQRLIYISCDPATLCRDLGELIPAGFTLSQLLPVDMFPQTHHIETVALLDKNIPCA